MCGHFDTCQVSAPWRSRRIARDERGVEVFEAALVLPILLTLLIGTFWLGRAYNVYQTITRAAREGARFALAPSCSTCTPNSSTFPSDSEVQAVINNALSASAMDPANVKPAISIQRKQVLNPSDPSSNQVQGVVISFGYPVKINVPFTTLNGTTITISTQVQMRQEL